MKDKEFWLKLIAIICVTIITVAVIITVNI